MTSVSRIVPTPEQLAAAFAASRLPGWPLHLEEAMADEVKARLINLHAVRLAMGHDDFAGRRTVHRPEVIRPEPPHPADAPAPRPPPQRAPAKRRPPPPPPPPSLFVDRKRAAAGDDD